MLNEIRDEVRDNYMAAGLSKDKAEEEATKVIKGVRNVILALIISPDDKLSVEALNETRNW